MENETAPAHGSAKKRSRHSGGDPKTWLSRQISTKHGEIAGGVVEVIGITGVEQNTNYGDRDDDDDDGGPPPAHSTGAEGAIAGKKNRKCAPDTQ